MYYTRPCTNLVFLCGLVHTLQCYVLLLVVGAITLSNNLSFEVETVMAGDVKT